MKTRNFALCALGLAAAITFGGGATASAQARSQKRIPVRKDQPAAEVRADTIRLPGRVDTVMVRGRTDTVIRTVERMRYDTVMQTLPLQRLPGTYFGVGAGVAIPMNTWRNSVEDGWDVQGQVGWFPGDGPLGLRADVNYANLFKRDTDCPNCPNTKLLAGSLDLVLRMPLDRTSKLNPVVYVLGGGGIDKISDFLPYKNTKGLVVTAGDNTYKSYPGITLPAPASSKSVFYHYEVGPGLDVSFGDAHFFVESKWSVVNTVNGSSHYWPTVVGLKFY